MKDRFTLGTLNQIVSTAICGQGLDSLWHVQYLDQDSYEWQLGHIYDHFHLWHYTVFKKAVRITKVLSM